MSGADIVFVFAVVIVVVVLLLCRPASALRTFTVRAAVLGVRQANQAGQPVVADERRSDDCKAFGRNVNILIVAYCETSAHDCRSHIYERKIWRQKGHLQQFV